MPKQKGLYQLQGKAQGMCYYSQAGVRLPLMRTINQGMSERVKTSEEFENTRKNNAEFALANKMATSLYNFIYPNWRSMFRRFTIPYITARLLYELKNGTGDWGERHLDKSVGIVFTPILNLYAKARAYQGEYGDFTATLTNFRNTYVNHYTYIRLTLTTSRDTMIRLKSQGVDGVMVYWRHLIGMNETIYESYLSGIAVALVAFDTSMPIASASGPDLVGTEFGVAPIVLDTYMAQTTSGVLSSAVICPYRQSGDERIILQKQCTYVVFGCDPKPQTQS